MTRTEIWSDLWTSLRLVVTNPREARYQFDQAYAWLQVAGAVKKAHAHRARLVLVRGGKRDDG